MFVKHSKNTVNDGKHHPIPNYAQILDFTLSLPFLYFIFHFVFTLFPCLTAFHFDNCDGKSIQGGVGVKNNRLSANIRDKLCKISRICAAALLVKF